MGPRKLCFGFCALFVAAFAQADHHNWTVTEIFTNDTGSLQFIEMHNANANDLGLTCCTFASTAAASYRFPNNVAASLNRHLLLATAGFEAAYGISPDFIIPDGFVPTAAGGIQYNPPLVSWSSIPTNGVDSLHIENGDLVTKAATPTNFDGDTITLAVDATAPVIDTGSTSAISISSNTTVSASDTRITSFFNAVSCTDETDTSPALAFELPASFSAGSETDIAITCTDAGGNTATTEVTVAVNTFTDTDNDGVANEVDDDDDGDGVKDVDDAFPEDPTETKDTDNDGIGDNADPDADGDGIDDDQDITPPTISLTTPVIANATGRLTSIELTATATDDQDSQVTPVPDNSGPFASGVHQVTWTATDFAGNTATAAQRIEITPRLRLQRDQVTAEGATATIELVLTGPPVSYPVTITFEATGTADGSDFLLPEAPLVIEQGTRTTLTIVTLQDEIAEGDETVIITMAATGAVVIDNTHTLTISEANLPPAANLTVRQDGETRTRISIAGGTVSLISNATDRNPDDALTFDWSDSSSSLALDNVNSETASFDPASTAPGSYTIAVLVSDGETSVRQARRIDVVANLPELTDSDTDGDGVDDLTEGHGDLDDDGIPDYLDDNSDTTTLPTAAGERAQLETDPGQRLRLGLASRASGARGARLNRDELGAIYGESAGDVGFRYDLGMFDFEIAGLAEPGASARLVIPVAEPLPAGSIYRKFEEDAGWRDFVTGATDAVSSAGDIAGACPPPGDGAYQAGLNAGDFCIQLTLADGGPNDADGAANSIIVDPGGPATSDAAPVLEVPADATAEATGTTGIEISSTPAQAFLTGASCTDDADGDIEVDVSADTIDLDTATALPIGATVLTFTCTDSADNSVEADSTLTVEDTTPPELSLAASSLFVASKTEVPATDSNISTFLTGATCTDLVDGDVEVTSDAPTEFQTGVTALTFTCSDSSGNTATSATTVTVGLEGSNNANDEGAGCFIATAAYGSYLDPHVVTLRQFRDETLLNHAAGRWFVDQYYQYSPPAADVIRQHPALMETVRVLLAPVVFGVVYPVRLALVLLLLMGAAILRRRIAKHRASSVAATG